MSFVFACCSSHRKYEHFSVDVVDIIANVQTIDELMKVGQQRLHAFVCADTECFNFCFVRDFSLLSKER